MHITIERANLVKPLDMLGRIVERRNTIPILSNLLLRAAGGKLCISATDLDMAATVDVAAEIHTAGAVTAPAHTLKEIVRKLPDGSQADLRLSDDGNQMTIRAGRSRFVLHTLPEQDWPDLTGPDGGVDFEAMGVEIDIMLQGVDFAISTEETRYYLNGVYLHAAPEADGSTLRGVATDGHRLAMRHATATVDVNAMPGVIVPRKAVAEIRKLAADRPASVMRMEVSANKMTVRCGAEEAVDCDYSGDPVDIGFNAAYVRDLLGVIDADRVEISLADGGSPALWRGLSNEAEGHTLVLMPMRV